MRARFPLPFRLVRKMMDVVMDGNGEMAREMSALGN